MSDTYIQNLFAERIGGSQYGKSTAIYKFEKIKRAKRAALAANPGAEIIDIGGESTRPGAVSVSEADELARQLVPSVAWSPANQSVYRRPRPDAHPIPTPKSPGGANQSSLGRSPKSGAKSSKSRRDAPNRTCIRRFRFPHRPRTARQRPGVR